MIYMVTELELVNRDAQGEIVDTGDDWLECIPWTGMEKDLPVGYTTKVPGLNIIKFIKSVEILDGESEEGSRFIKMAERKEGDIIIGVKLNEKSIERVVANYGPSWIVLKHANGGKSYNRLAWRDKYGTDGLALLAIRNLRTVPIPKDDCCV